MSGYDVKIRPFRVGVPMLLLLVGQRGMEPTSTSIYAASYCEIHTII